MLIANDVAKHARLTLDRIAAPCAQRLDEAEATLAPGIGHAERAADDLAEQVASRGVPAPAATGWLAHRSTARRI
jgi:hypothetical protein